MTGKSIIAIERIAQSILFVRGQKVLLDSDLADLYGVETRSLIQAVKRNIDRFPSDFMFQLTPEEYDSLRSQIVISKGKGGRRYLPYAFTEQGVAMLSSVLNSHRAVEVNIAIMRVFVHLRRMIVSHADLAKKFTELEAQFKDHDEKIEAIFEVIHQLISPDEKLKKKRIGYTVKEKQASYGRRSKGKGSVRT